MPPGEGTGRAPLAIGVDGGASGVRALAVELAGCELRPAGPPSARAFDDGFEPTPLAEQRAQQRAPRIEARERAAGERRVALAAACIAEAVALASPEPSGGGTRIRVGLCWPGVKSADGRGVLVAAHGPRLPGLAPQLEARLVDLGLEPSAPLGPLRSDGWCGALGELRAAGGALAGVGDGYWLGGGSGLAEGLVLGGELVPLDAELAWFPRAWTLVSAAGPSFEELIAPGPVGRRWRARAGLPVAGRGEDACVHPEQRAESDVSAVAALTNQGTWLARLVFERLLALRARGAICERVVVAQRLAEVARDPRAEPFVWGTAERELARLLALEAPDDLAGVWLASAARAQAFRPLAAGRFVRSTLRLAPALGAGLAVLLAAAEEA